MDNLEHVLEGADTIVFVCSGNIIRSAFAHILVEHLADQLSPRFLSTGTRYHNTSIHHQSAQKLQEMGVKQELINGFNPTHISELQIDNSEQTVYLVMTRGHQKDLLSIGINDDNIYLLTRLLGKQEEVADPYFEGNFNEAFDTIESAVGQLLDILKI